MPGFRKLKVKRLFLGSDSGDRATEVTVNADTINNCAGINLQGTLPGNTINSNTTLNVSSMQGHVHYVASNCTITVPNSTSNTDRHHFKAVIKSSGSAVNFALPNGSTTSFRVAGVSVGQGNSIQAFSNSNNEVYEFVYFESSYIDVLT